LKVVGGIIGGGWLLRLAVFGFLVVCEVRSFGVSLGVGSSGWVWVCWGLGAVLEVVWSRAGAEGGGFHALQLNMLSWFEFFTRVLRGFLFG
jgi:hypothetical protein